MVFKLTIVIKMTTIFLIEQGENNKGGNGVACDFLLCYYVTFTNNSCLSNDCK